MIPAVADSGPFIHLAILEHTALLHRYFHPLFILPQVYDEVVTQGAGRPGMHAVATACARGEVHVIELRDAEGIGRLRQGHPGLSSVSEVDIRVVALALAQQVLLLTDDHAVRLLATAHSVPVMGSIGILIRARLEGVIEALKPLLDQLIAAGFHLDPQGTSTARPCSASVRTESGLGHITVVLPQLSCSVSKSHGLTFADGVTEPVSGLAVGP